MQWNRRFREKQSRQEALTSLRVALGLLLGSCEASSRRFRLPLFGRLAFLSEAERVAFRKTPQNLGCRHLQFQSRKLHIKPSSVARSSVRRAPRPDACPCLTGQKSLTFRSAFWRNFFEGRRQEMARATSLRRRESIPCIYFQREMGKMVFCTNLQNPQSLPAVYKESSHRLSIHSTTCASSSPFASKFALVSSASAFPDTNATTCIQSAAAAALEVEDGGGAARCGLLSGAQNESSYGLRLTRVKRGARIVANIPLLSKAVHKQALPSAPVAVASWTSLQMASRRDALLVRRVTPAKSLPKSPLLRASQKRREGSARLPTRESEGPSENSLP